ncbi:hypothetical protein NC651_000691 [Populus alba x Populus x berolinensis]|nr:hypothetical protein NC651_000691 [Populus alba x Populus x berolinensis]
MAYGGRTVSLTLTFAIFLGDATEFWITCVRRSWICSGFSNKLPPCYALVGVHCYLLGVVDSLDAWHMDTKARRFIGMLADHGA